MTTARALDGIRVLDLTTPLGEAAGRVFADLGAEVLTIEPPGGCAARFTAPFVDGQAGHAEGSLFWRAFGLGKKSVVLDLEAARDRECFLALARGADVLLESSTPGTLDALGFGPEALARENPTLLYVSITPYGQQGPLAKAPATDLTIAAAGSLPNMQGDRDRPPLPVGFSEASCHGAVQAAAEAILALLERERTGLGQHLDASMQAAMLWTLLFVTGHATLYGEDVPGYGAQRGDPQPQLLPGVTIPNVARTKDGFTRSPPSAAHAHQHEIHHVGSGRSGDEGPALSREEAVRIVVRERRVRVRTHGRPACERGAVHIGTCRRRRPVAAIGPCREKCDARVPCELDRSREGELLGPAAPAPTAHGHGGLAAREE
jgi:hypothetical protein